MNKLKKSNKLKKLNKSKKYKFRKDTRKLLGGASITEACVNDIKKGIVQALDNKITSLSESEKKQFVEEYKKKITGHLTI